MKLSHIEIRYYDGLKMNLAKDQNKYFISLDKDEYVNQSLLDISNSEGIQSGWLSGVGAIYDIEVGYFDVEKKDYIHEVTINEGTDIFEFKLLPSNKT